MTNIETITPITTYSVITIEKPSKYHTWVNNEWILNETGLNSYKEELYIKLKSKREEVLENGILFEGDKLIKGRTQDLADAMAVFMMLQNGAEKTYWFYSNGVVEEVNATKMTQIYQSIGNFRSSQFANSTKNTSITC